MSRMIAIAALAVLSSGASAQDSAAAARVDRVFARFDSSTTPGCAVGLARDGHAVVEKAYGMANLEYAVPLSAQSILESGSVAKQFTAAALALLQLDGKLSLDDDIRKHLPEVPDFGAPVTIRMLLTHTSGLRDQWGLLTLTGNPPGRQVHTLPLILDLVSRQRELNFPPGSEYLYSNTGYALVAMIVARVSGQPFAAFTRDRLFVPLGMSHTEWRDDFRRVVRGRATAYSSDSGRWVQDMPFTNVHGNGGLLTTVGDLLRWNDALTSGHVPGGRPLVDVLETRGRLTSGRTISYALGLGHGTYRGSRLVGHSGSTAGYQTYLGRLPDEKLSVAVLCNAGNAPASTLAMQTLDVLLPAPVATTKPAADTTGLGAFSGTYRDPRSDNLATFVLGAAGLTVRSFAGGGVLEPRGASSFALPNGARFVFSGGARPRRVRVTDADSIAVELEEVVPPAAPALDAYAGRYRSPELDVSYDVRVADGKLVIQRRPDPPLRLMPLYTDGFTDGTGYTVRFTRDGAGRVTAFRVYAGRIRAVLFERVADR